MAEQFDLNAEVQKISTLAKTSLSPRELKAQEEAGQALGDEVHRLCKAPEYKQVVDALTSATKQGFTVTEGTGLSGSSTLNFKNPYGQLYVDCNGAQGGIWKSLEK